MKKEITSELLQKYIAEEMNKFLKENREEILKRAMERMKQEHGAKAE